MRLVSQLLEALCSGNQPPGSRERLLESPGSESKKMVTGGRAVESPELDPGEEVLSQDGEGSMMPNPRKS